MKVFKRYETTNYTYPEDMKKILDYLNSVGTILVEDRTIEELYYAFSHDRYAAGWIGVDNQILEEFADWLDDYEL